MKIPLSFELYDMQRKSHFRSWLGIRKNRRGCRATTLVELLVVITLVSVLLLVVGTLAVHLRKWDRQVRDHSQRGYQLAILAETIRADVRRARSAALPAKNILAIAGRANRETRYELQLEVCRRVVNIPGETSSKIETFTIGPADSWKLETGAPGRRPAYALWLERSASEKASSRSTPFYVYAVLGSDVP
jgi:type II secretory pathway pseudopilin PulG